MNPFLSTDGYKTGHHLMYPEGTSMVYSNFTPRSNKYGPPGCDYVVSFGQQLVVRQIRDLFNKHFFGRAKNAVLGEIKREYSAYLGSDYNISHIEALWDLGYLPLHIKALPEGTKVPIGVPVLTIYNTLPEFYWLTNFLETLISNLLWKPMTSATLASLYKDLLLEYANKTDVKNLGFVNFQGHDFSMRGLDALDAAMSSGLGHITSFLGTDSLPSIHGARKYYDQIGDVCYSVPATEHSVMCAGSKEGEIETFRRLMETFPTGILSVVSDTWDLWEVLTNYLPQLKDEILNRDGKLVIRPDSGDPVDIICGVKILNSWDVHSGIFLSAAPGSHFKHEGRIYRLLSNYPTSKRRIDHYINDNKVLDVTDEPYVKGVVELLWDTFGGTTNAQGYKILDPHIGCLYGDSITLDRAKQICKRLEAKGFASTNVVLGIGSFTYQFNTRDTFGFAMKATYVEIDGVGQEIYKDPTTDSGTKKSAKGLLAVYKDAEGKYFLKDQVTWLEEKAGELQTIFYDGRYCNQVTLTDIRERLAPLG